MSAFSWAFYLKTPILLYTDMVTKEELEEFISNLLNHNDIDLDGLNEIATSISPSSLGAHAWSRVIEVARQVTSIPKREAMGVAIFELMAEEPVHSFWLASLPEILGNRDLYWIVVYAYKHFRPLLFDHLCLLSK